MNQRSVKDIVGALAVGAAGTAFFVGALELDPGTSHRMGPGYFPLVVASASIVVAILLLIFGRQSVDRSPTRIAWRPLLAVLAAIGAFAALVDRFGLAPAVAAAVLIASLGDRPSRPAGILVLAACTALGAWLIFRVGLGLELPAFRFRP